MLSKYFGWLKRKQFKKMAGVINQIANFELPVNCISVCSECSSLEARLDHLEDIKRLLWHKVWEFLSFNC